MDQKAQKTTSLKYRMKYISTGAWVGLPRLLKNSYNKKNSKTETP